MRELRSSDGNHSVSCGGSYQFGVVGGDLEGKLFVSRCSDEIDLRRTGFHTIPPTTRWHTGPPLLRRTHDSVMETTVCGHTYGGGAGLPLSFTVTQAQVLGY